MHERRWSKTVLYAVEIIIAVIGVLLNVAQLLGGWDAFELVQLLLWIALGVQAWRRWGEEREKRKRPIVKI